MNTRESCIADVSRPGRFEGEAPYVPYYWDIYMDGGADRDDGTVIGFNVTAEDKATFPELKRRRTVNIYQDDYGFIREVRS